MVMVIGIDPHKASHTAVAVDSTGKVVGQVTVKARDQGHTQLLSWGRRVAGDERVWAVEDCRHVSGRLERALLVHGERVVRVPPKLMGRLRREQRGYGKSDPIDATAVARAALREGDLPVATLAGRSLDVRLLVDRREDLVGERTREINRIQWHLHDLDPDLPAKGRLTTRRGLQHIADRLDQLDGVRAQVCRESVERVDQLNHVIDEYQREIEQLVRQHWPELLDIDGCGVLSAAKLVGEIGDPRRFSREQKLAMHAGVAPLPVSSGERQRHRLNRHGNRQLNVAIHRIAVNQCKKHGSAGRAYRDRKMSEGKTKLEALRCLKRQISRTIYRTLREASVETAIAAALT